MKAKLITSILICVSLLFLTACRNTFTNLTPQRIPQNPSGIYTLSFAAKIPDTEWDNNSLRATITIDGQTHPMRRTSPEGRMFEYDYAMPPSRNTAKYYFQVEYLAINDGISRNRDFASDTYTLTLTNRYVIAMQSSRGPVGAEIPVVGRGFGRSDRIAFDGVEADTRYSSSVALTFTVPPLSANRDYAVTLITGSGILDVGSFRIDPSQIRVSPNAIQMNSGESRVLLFSVQRPAPEGGLLIDVTTDIPQSIVMSPVRIPAGSKTNNIRIEAGIPGTGKLFISAPGFEPLEIPVTVEGGSAAQPIPAPSTAEALPLPVDSTAAESLIIQE